MLRISRKNIPRRELIKTIVRHSARILSNSKREDDSFSDILSKYPINHERQKKYPITIGILSDFSKHYEKYTKACEELGVQYSVIDFTSHHWLEEVVTSNCDGYFVHPSVDTNLCKGMFDERIRVMVDELGLIVWPRIEDLWFYEGKRRLAYWLEAKGIPHPNTYVFYDEAEAIDFLSRANYPLIYKTHLGSAASGVIRLKNQSHAIRLIKKAFSKGVIRDWGDRRERDWGYIILQEYIPDAREFRIIKIGDSWFGHEKLMDPKSHFHSGSDLVGWGSPPLNVFEFCLSIAEIGKFPIMCFDIFSTQTGKLLVNELQVAFGSYNPSQMYICENEINQSNSVCSTGKKIPHNLKPGRYIHQNGEWLFEEGLFNRNGSANLKIETFAEYLTTQKGVRENGR